MDKPNGQGLGRIFRAGKASLAGFKAAFVNEAAFRQELLLVICLAPLAFWLGQTGLEKALLLASLILDILFKRGIILKLYGYLD